MVGITFKKTGRERRPGAQQSQSPCSSQINAEVILRNHFSTSGVGREKGKGNSCATGVGEQVDKFDVEMEKWYFHEMKQKWMVRGDIDGFFGLFIDNLLQLLLIMTLVPLVCGIEVDFLMERVMPAAALSILGGNLFYAWQARRLAAATGRADVTALPYGINTVSLIAYIFLIMGPIYRETGDANLAWKTGVFACLLSAVMELAGAFLGDPLRRHTPRAALLASLAGIAITFISMGFVFQIFASPAVGLIPMLLILASYASRIKFPLGLPGGLIAVTIGVAIAWGLRWAGMGLEAPAVSHVAFGLYLPVPVVGEVVGFLLEPTGWKYLAVIFPMGLFNVIGSLQALESADAAGDHFPTKPSLAANAVGSFVAAMFGSMFPTTLYIGHPGWKAMGARSAYSSINGVVITLLCFAGAISSILLVIPIEATLGILLWLGVIITAQAFQEVPRSHALAVAVGLVPALGAWALFLIETSLRVAGTNLFQTASKFGNDLFIYGVIALNQGFILSSMILAAVMVHIIERNFKSAGLWLLSASVLSCFGLIHAFELTALGVQNKFGFLAAPEFTAGYALAGLAMFALKRFA